MSIYEEVDYLLQQFYWNNNIHATHIFTPVAWSHFSQPKEVGGMSFSILQDFNQVVLAKASCYFIIHLGHSYQ